MTRITKAMTLALFALVGLAPLGARADLAIPWFTIDGGGGVQTGGALTLDGTIGQPDAAAPLTGGRFSLTGGFWASSASAGPVVCPGDCNCDGQLDFGDVNAFVDALLSMNYCDGTGGNADVNQDGSVGFGDINPFVELLTSNPLPILCP